MGRSKMLRAYGGQRGNALRALAGCLFALLAQAQLALADSWIQAETSHFVIFSNVGESKTREYLEQLEAFKYLAELVLGTDPNSAVSSARFTIYLLDDQALLKTVRPSLDRYVAGVYLRCVEGARAFAYRPERWDPTQPDQGLVILRHEYAHHVMFSRIRRFYPAWYVEGFADYLGAIRFERGKYIVAGSNDMRVRYLTGDTRWIDFNVLLDPAQFAAAVKEGEINSLQFYAQAWLLTHYMLADSERTRGFNEYFERTSSGEDAISSFESTTGIPVAELASELRTHLRKLPGFAVRVPDLPKEAVTVTRFPKSRGDYLLEAAVLQTCPDEEYGLELTKRLRAMRTKHAGDAGFRLELSRAELLFGDAHAARTELEALAQSETADFELSYLLGRSYYEAAQTDAEQSDALMSKARDRLVQAYKLKKLDAPTLYFLSRALDTEFTPSKSVHNAAVGAAALAPSVASYAIHAASVSLRSGDKDVAARVMQPFTSDPHNPAYAARVTAMIKAIREDKSFEEIMSALASESSTE